MTKSREEYSENLESEYKRMERTHNRIVYDFENKDLSKNSEERLDDIYSFFSICYHLKEWIQKDNKINQTIKNRLPIFIGESSSVQFQMCRDLCNKSKHVALKETRRHKPNDVNTKIITYGGSICSVSKKELEEAQKKKETIHLKEEDEIFLGNYKVSFRGDFYDLKGVVQSCMYIWKKFFEENDLLLPRSTPYNIK